MKKLVYSCSGCSSAAQMANWIAIQLDRMGVCEMSCIAGVGGGVLPLIKKAASADFLVTIDGCALACAAHCLKREGFESDAHYDLSQMKVKKKFHGDFNLNEARKILALITEDLKKNKKEFIMKENISSFYTKDHDRLDELFKEYQVYKKSDYSKAKKAFLEFNHGLRQHIQWEEDLLFPFFEKKTSMAHCGPTEVMRQEHVEIEEILNQIKSKVHHADPNTDDQERALLMVLGNHNAKEEQILYPMIDQVSDGNEKGELFKKMKSSLIKSNCCCC